MKNMSFSMTTEAMEQRRKTVTRRAPNTWGKLKPGDRLQAVEKAMGLPKGSTVRRLAVIEIVSVRVELLTDITDEDVAREGFEGKDAAWFVAMYLEHVGAPPVKYIQTMTDDGVFNLHVIRPVVYVRRIEFRYVEES